MSDAFNDGTVRCFSGFDGAGVVDEAAGVIRGVSVITSGVEAEGHDLRVDGETVRQLFSCAQQCGGTVPVNLNHGEKVQDGNGYLTNFRVDGKKLRADWHLLASHDETPRLFERARKQPGHFGLSVKFKGGGVKEKDGKTGKMVKLARCERLLSVDLVTRPAANPDGLFSARDGVRVDRGRGGTMANENTNTTQQEPTLRDLMAKLDRIEQRQEEQDAMFAQMQAQQAAGNLQLEDLMEASDEELASLGLTRAEVDEAVMEAMAQQQAEEGQQQGGDGDLGQQQQQGYADAGQGYGEQGALAGAGAGGGGAGGAGGASSFAALQRQVVELRARLDGEAAAAVRAEEEHAFAVVEAKVTELAARNEELVKELAAKDAEITALRENQKTGHKGMLRSGVQQFAAGAAAGGQGQQKTFEVLFQAKAAELMKGGLSEAAAKGQAVLFCVRHHTAAYEEFRSRGGGILTL